MLRFDGHYATGPEPWEDWHAGVRMHGISFHYIRFYGDATWLGCCVDEEFGFWEFTENISEDFHANTLLGKLPNDAMEYPPLDGGQWQMSGNSVTRLHKPEWAGGVVYKYAFQVFRDGLKTADEKTHWQFYPAD